ncbi:MAG: hypothetical protein JSU95_10345 [Betaproteobacteria bacterium]|nr:MAG: hypothetical protein JSU95_10345 [Betaproteobacteria bacterium]
MRSLAIGGAVLLAVAGSASADNTWRLASDSARGDVRFLLDISQLDHYINGDGRQLFGVPLRAVGNGIVKDGYVVIDAKSCLAPGGEMIMTIGDASQRFWWSVDGKRMYDAVGVSVCNVAAAMYEAVQASGVDPSGPRQADAGISRQ